MPEKKFLELGEYGAAGLYEECDRGLLYRKSLGLRRYFEHCEPPVYNGELLYPSGVVTPKMTIRPHFHYGLYPYSQKFNEAEPELVQKMTREFCVFCSTIPPEHTVAGNMWIHSMPNYERILSEGLLSYIPRIEKIVDVDMREGLLHLVAGIRCYVERCVEYLRSVSADEGLITALSQVPLYPARDIREAIVGWNFIMYLDNCDNLGAIGRGLLPYYKGENIVPLLENLYDNIDQNDGYSTSLDAKCPELTVQCLKAAHGKRRPMIELFVDDDTPEEIWQAAFETLFSGGGQPAFYNKEVLFGGLKKRFPTIRDEDFERFCGGGCTESMLAGLSAVGSLDAGINLLLILEQMMRSHLSSAKSFDEFYEAYLEEVGAVVEKIKREISNSRIRRSRLNPVPMRTLLVDDCIDNGKEYHSGGARYNWSIISFAGMINVIDSLLSIKGLVFEEKKYTPEELLALLEANDDSLLSEVIGRAKSYGKDDEEVNRFSRDFSKRVFAMTEGGEPLAFGEGFLSASIQFMSQAIGGKNIGATPDGRRVGEPLCDSLAAIFGKDTNGPTALLNSVTSLDLASALGTPVVNFNITRQFNDDILKALILGYMKKGGIHLQITCASKEELIDAYEHPERHGNLIVRVGGYSEYFNRLSDDLKKMIIDRTIQNGKTI